MIAGLTIVSYTFFPFSIKLILRPLYPRFVTAGVCKYRTRSRSYEFLRDSHPSPDFRDLKTCSFIAEPRTYQLLHQCSNHSVSVKIMSNNDEWTPCSWLEKQSANVKRNFALKLFGTEGARSPMALRERRKEYVTKQCNFILNGFPRRIMPIISIHFRIMTHSM